MNPARGPFGSFLRRGASEEELQRVWRGIQQQRSQKPARWRSFLLVATVLSSIVLAGLVRWWPVTRTEGALRDENGRALLILETRTPRTTVLSDGSRIELATDSALEVLENDGNMFVCALRRGRVTLDVVPGGPRRFRVEAGAVAIEVVGTRFLVDRRESSVVIEVERGSVLVRGENVRDGVQKLLPGSRLEVSVAQPVNPETPRALPHAPEASSAATTAGAPEGADEGRLGAASARAPAPSTDLLTLADQQRRRGDVKAAIQTLKLAVERAPDNTRGAMAAFTLGKLLLDGVGQPVEAQAAFRACLKRSPPAVIAEDALARLVEAQSRSGAQAAALATASEYQRRYPNGRWLSDVRRWTSVR
jgi:transmembrane sensor